MMNSSSGASVLFFSIIFLLPVVVFWLNDLICRRQFSAGFAKIRLAFWLLSGSSMGVILYSRLLRSASDDWSALFHGGVNLSYVWTIGQIILLALLMIVFGSLWLVRQVKRLLTTEQRTTSKPAKQGLSRRDFLKTAAAALPIAAFGLSAEGVYQASKLTPVERTLTFHNLPQALHNFTIAQISDTHLGPFFTLDKLDEALQIVRQRQPHLLVITGDLIDDLSLLSAAIEKITALKDFIPYGIYFCWGNHEYFRNKPRIAAALNDSAITLLDNSSQLLFPGTRPVYLLGVDYPWSKSKAEEQQVMHHDLLQARKNIPEQAFCILLAHHPDFFNEAFAVNMPLTLSGHTHGGQVALFGHSLLPIHYQYMRGLYQQQNCYGYVSTGTGQWLPFRLNCPAEVAFFTLVPA
jgi:predicted MPP superfamily phosphohydrolase/heme exporter protein D